MARRQQKSCIMLSPVWLLVLVIVGDFVLRGEAQFFTKSSKSIPRMGRRSLEAPFQLSQQRRALINSLIDQFGPSLLENLESKADAEMLSQSRDFSPKTEDAVNWSFAHLHPSSSLIYRTDPISGDEEEQGPPMSKFGLREEPAFPNFPTFADRNANSAFQVSVRRLAQMLSPLKFAKSSSSQDGNKEKQQSAQTFDGDK